MKQLQFICIITLLAAMLYSCSSDDTVTDPPLTDPMLRLRDLSLSDFVIDTDTIDVVPGRDKSPDDHIVIVVTVRVQVDGEAKEVVCNVTLDGKSQILLSQPLEESGGSFWSAALQLSRRRGDVGDYRIEVVAANRSGQSANVAISKLRVIYGMQPPVLHEVFAPDTLQIQETSFTAVIAVRVSDPAGLSDIKQVFFNSFLPNGMPSQGNPFILRDDGNYGSGDDVAGDGIYSIRISVPPTAMIGKYRFEFRAIDYSNLTSNLLIHTITMI